MNLREGKIGPREAITAIAIVLCTNGIFSLESKRAYSHGNSTYVSIPLAILLSVLFFVFIGLSIRKTRSSDLYGLFNYSVGNVFTKLYSYLLTAMLLLSAIVPLERFLEMMHSYFFVDMGFADILVYMIPTVIIIAWLGLETITRTSKLISILLLLAIISTLANAASNYESYRLYPLLGDGIKHILGFSFSEVCVFLPALLFLLTLAKSAVQGIRFSLKAGIIGSAIAFVICAVTQLCIGLSFTYNDLAMTNIPLYELNKIIITEIPLLRFETLSIFLLLLGGLLTPSFFLYAASNVFAKSSNIHDIRPVILGFGIIMYSVVLSMHLEVLPVSAVITGLWDYAVVILLVLSLFFATIGLIKNRKEQTAK